MLVGKRGTHTRGFIELLFWYIQNKNNGFEKFFQIPGLPLANPPFEFPPIRFANTQMLAKKRMAENRSFTKFLFWLI